MITEAAIRLDGRVYTGRRHGDILDVVYSLGMFAKVFDFAPELSALLPKLVEEILERWISHPLAQWGSADKLSDFLFVFFDTSDLETCLDSPFGVVNCEVGTGTTKLCRDPVGIACQPTLDVA